MSKVKWKGSTLLAPVPAVMVTCGTTTEPKVLTIAWTGIINSSPPKTYISVRPERASYNTIKETKEFVINLTTSQLVRATDYCGVKSSKTCDKFKAMGLELENSNEVSAPTLKNSPLALECKVTDTIELGSHTMFIADILCVNVEEEIIDTKGKLRLDKCSLLAYAHGEYYALGKKLGTFGYSVAKKKHKKTFKK